jgi:hypothetical protein
MAATITVNATVRAVDTSVSLNETVNLTKVYTATGNDYGFITQSISSSTHVVITLPATIATSAIGQFTILNTDSTNYVSLGGDNGGTFVPFLRIRAGRFAVGEYEPTTLYAKANTAAVVIAHKVFDL